jgi:uncharacterized protein YggE
MALAASPVFAQTPRDDTPVIVAQGSGSLKRAPDQAWVSISAEARAAKPGDAQRQSAAAMTALQTALTSVGLANDAVKTVNYSVRPDVDYTNGSSRVKGYIASNQIEVRVDDLSKVSGVIDAAGASGATSIAGLRFDLKDRAGAEREALRLAVQDAMSRAQAMASGAGRSVGPILKVEEQRSFQVLTQTFMRASGAAAADTPIAAGESEIRAQVVLTVGIR